MSVSKFTIFRFIKFCSFLMNKNFIRKLLIPFLNLEMVNKKVLQMKKELQTKERKDPENRMIISMEREKV